VLPVSRTTSHLVAPYRWEPHCRFGCAGSRSSSDALVAGPGDKGEDLLASPDGSWRAGSTFALNLTTYNAYYLALAERVRDRDRRHCSASADCMVVSPEEFVT
jgi:hypothetical protein